ncbi:hypothetical protein [Kosakonia sp.]|uniref:hypothetical protein n=1 Tax=Kosakonia sp. TaxID=1916651 RepID=UPI0028AD7050|nr:hypothetical protein [Kosakonia sp.]
MPSKLKLRRQRRLKADLWWWREEAKDLHARVMEQADEIAALRRQIFRVPMPVLVPAPIMKLVAPATSEPEICLKCNDGARLGCSSCAYRLK